MTDYGKLKVTELKEQLKHRSIPLTGLKVKQDYIDRLLKADAADEVSNSPAATAAPGDGTSRTDVEARDDASAVAAAAAAATEKVEPSRSNEAVEGQSANESAQASESNLGTLAAVKDGQLKENDAVDEEPQASTPTEPQDTTIQPTPALTAIEDRTTEPPAQPNATSVHGPEASSSESTAQPTPQSTSDRVNTPQPQPAQASLTNTPSSGRVPSVEFLEDSRKRKRRSVTPPPSTIEMAWKKVKGSDGSPRVIQREESSLEELSQQPKDIDVTTNGHGLPKKAIEEAPRLEGGPHSSSQDEPTEPEQIVGRSSRGRSPVPRAPSQQHNEHPPEPEQKKQRSSLKSPARSRPRSPNVLKRRSPSLPKALALASEDRVITPALHPATSSLYIRNFKRPLHIPSLRSHISAVAASPNTDAGDDSIASFYLDSIRTHAFLSFHSIAAASRARSALHDSRFPDEKTREPLWVDFVPDEKIEEWIETEQKAHGGGRIGRRWEVVYEDSANGIEAILQEVGSGPGARPAPQRKAPAPLGRRDSEIAGSTPTMTGVHPDRARLVPPEDNLPPRRESTLGQEQRPEQTGTGFRALDDLFASTTAKPKLYYKSVGAHVAEERLDMIKDLRNLAGAKSGDPDMKRYSLELDRGREGWVDKGPEFGFGARGRGMDRGGRGGYRGRGGAGRGSDTWRSGGRY